MSRIGPEGKEARIIIGNPNATVEEVANGLRAINKAFGQRTADESDVQQDAGKTNDQLTTSESSLRSRIFPGLNEAYKRIFGPR